MKKRKLYHFSDLINDKIMYFDFMHVKDGNENKGVKFLLSDPLTESQKEKLSKYDNIIISSVSYKYAPEIKHDTIILLK